jgi:hypothetical protein
MGNSDNEGKMRKLSKISDAPFVPNINVENDSTHASNTTKKRNFNSTKTQGGIEEETILVHPWEKIKQILLSMGFSKESRTRTSSLIPHGGGETLQLGFKSLWKQVGSLAARSNAGSANSSTRSSIVKAPSSKKNSLNSGFLHPPNAAGLVDPTTLRKTLKSVIESSQEVISFKVGDDVIDEERESSTSEEENVVSRHDNGGTALAITIPHGFQLTRTIPHTLSNMKSVIYVSSNNSDAFAILDSQNMTILRGSVKSICLSVG